MPGKPKHACGCDSSSVKITNITKYPILEICSAYCQFIKSTKHGKHVSDGTCCSFGSVFSNSALVENVSIANTMFPRTLLHGCMAAHKKH
jgi:hypothetical protein